MKKAVSILSVIALLMSLCTGMLVSVTAVTADAEEVDLLAAQETFGDTTTPIVSDPVQGNGDVDGDGTVTMRDAVVLYHFINNKTALTQEEQARGQVTSPYDSLNIADVITLYNTVLGAVNAPAESSPTGDRPATADADAVFTIDVSTGQEIKAAISINGVDALTALCFRLRYDTDVLRVVSAEESGWMGEMNTSDINTRLTNGEVWLGGMDIGEKSVVQGEVVATIIFEAIGDITGEIPIGGIYAEAIDGSLQPLVATWVGGTTVDKVVTTTTTTTTMPADSNIVITVETVRHMGTMPAGEQFVVRVSAKINGGVSSGQFRLRYDNTRLKAVCVEIAGFATEMSLADITMSPEKVTTTDPNESEIGFACLEAQREIPCDSEQVFAVITFEAITDITEDTVVYLSEADFMAGVFFAYDVACVNGGVDITDEPFVVPEWPPITTVVMEDRGLNWLPDKQSVVITDGVETVDSVRHYVELKKTPCLYLRVKSEVPFDIVFNEVGVGSVSAVPLSDQFYTVDGHIPAGDYTIAFSLAAFYRGKYTETEWENLKEISVVGVDYQPQGEGYFEVSYMQIGNARGDLDGDDAVMSADARKVMRHVICDAVLSDAQKPAADYNGDGQINTSDVRAMLCAIVEE